MEELSALVLFYSLPFFPHHSYTSTPAYRPLQCYSRSSSDLPSNMAAVVIAWSSIIVLTAIPSVSPPPSILIIIASPLGALTVFHVFLHRQGDPYSASLASHHPLLHAQLSNIPRRTLPLNPPPTFPPPPPPPIEDIPQRSPAPMRQHSFGPSVRGNYSDNDFRRQQMAFSEGEMEMENPYMVQNNPGSVFSPGDGPRFPRTVPRSGSVPSYPGQPIDVASGSLAGYSSDTYPYHCPNQEHHAMLTHANTVDRQGSNYPQFGVPSMPPGSYPPSNDYTYYSKFSTASHRMKKQISQRCTWKCTALLLLIMCVALLACTVYFAGRSGKSVPFCTFSPCIRSFVVRLPQVLSGSDIVLLKPRDKRGLMAGGSRASRFPGDFLRETRADLLQPVLLTMTTIFPTWAGKCGLRDVSNLL
ncbi:hypothetical protein BaRGS_00013465 [Batillaria attramentaria]|uniref:Uncharacterized protein n=1 Tax=Batillaria attramentaria TaxID=370345 RepID=A0ABD0L7J6_9CAEN